MGEAKPFSSKSTTHGKEHELARKDFATLFKASHSNVKVKETGMWVSQQCPIIATSPDGIVKCDCCGVGALEIKCPYSDSILIVEEYARKDTSEFFKVQHKTVVIVEEGDVVVNIKHPYYTQIQTQLYCCNLPFAYLVVATKSDCDNLRYFRVEKDFVFHQSMITKAKFFF